MIITRGVLQTLFVGYNAAFNQGFAAAPQRWNSVAELILSTTSKNEYGWLAQIPQVREWIGERHVQELGFEAYSLANREFESTWKVKRKELEDDDVGHFGPMFRGAGQDAARFVDRSVFRLLKDGFTSLCYDGQFFFDSDHPILSENGVAGTFSNTGGGSGTNWFLLDTTQFLKPLIFQRRKDWMLVRKDREEDDNTFMRAEYLYGLDARMAFGYGIPQFAFGSKQTLDATSYAAARQALMSMKRHGDVPLDLMPNLLVVPPSLEGAARTLLEAERNAAGATNIYRNTAELLVTNYVA